MKYGEEEAGARGILRAGILMFVWAMLINIIIIITVIITSITTHYYCY